MSLIPLERAKLHLRVDTDDDDLLITGQLVAAESLAMAWIRRNVYATREELTAALQAVPANLAAATVAYEAELAMAMEAPTALERHAAIAAAQEAFGDAQGDAKRTRRGQVVGDLFASAVLLTLGALYDNRELLEPPAVAQCLLDPLRAYG